MGFWIFMLIMDLLLPFTMIGFGRYFMKKAPKEINSVFGYCVLFVGVKPVIKLGRTLFWRIIPFIVQNADKKD